MGQNTSCKEKEQRRGAPPPYYATSNDRSSLSHSNSNHGNMSGRSKMGQNTSCKEKEQWRGAPPPYYATSNDRSSLSHSNSNHGNMSGRSNYVNPTSGFYVVPKPGKSGQKFTRPNKTKRDYTVPVTSVVEGKYVCLMCDVRGMTSQAVLDDHMNGKKHRENVAKFSTPGAKLITRH